MADSIRCQSGEWVEVRYVLLEPEDRAANLPVDTAAQPLLVWIKGFARGAASLGETLEVETTTGRVVAGVLTDVNPGYMHTFGRPAPELVSVGRDLCARLAAYRAAAPKAGE